MFELLFETSVVPIIFSLVLILSLVFYFIIKNVDKQVKVRSKVLAKLLEINHLFDFHDVEDSFKIYKFYDNKSNFNKIEPAYLMTAEIKNNIVWFKEYISYITENREMHSRYIAQLDCISFSDNAVLYSRFAILNSLFCAREKALFNKMKLHPTVDCNVDIKISYSSPQGKVNLDKQTTLNFDDLFICYNSISRSYLDKNTIKALHLVERGEISDSLRYDILSRDNFKCVICGASANQGAKLHVDHIIPISKGGKSTPENLRTLCERCNMGKSDKIESVNVPLNKTTDNSKLTCEICGSELVIRTGKYGKFYGCSNYPKCRFTRPFGGKGSN